MGLDHGKLLAGAVRYTLDSLIAFSVGRGTSEAQLRKIYRSFEAFIPPAYKDEMRGLAEGAGVDLSRVQIAHAMPSRYHCTGAAVWGKATADGHLYHTRSLDYSLKIGLKAKKVQEDALLIVAQPEGDLGYAYLSWPGFLGAVSGMNAAGVSLGEMGSQSADETYAGVPMIFLCREILRRARNVDEGAAIFRAGPRTAGFNFILAQARPTPRAIAIELTRSRMVVYDDDDPAERTGSHWPLKDALRRSNHFVGKKMARTQGGRYLNRDIEDTSSFLAYKIIGEFIEEDYGKLQAPEMIRLLRLYPPSHACLHQAVFCPTKGVLWVSQALSPGPGRNAGAQNNTFYRYDLQKLIAGVPPTEGFLFNGPNDELTPPGTLRLKPTTGRVVESSDGLAGAAPLFRYAPGTFQYEMEPVRSMSDADVFRVRFPTPLPGEHASNNVVHAELYQPKGAVRGAAVVLHILKGRFEIARLFSSYLARNGIVALFIKLPFYGERNPGLDANGREFKMISANLDRTERCIRQGVMDVRRAVSLLAERENLPVDRVGVVGVSLGALVGALAMANDARVGRGVLILGGGDLPHLFWHGKETRRLREKLRRAGFDPKSIAERIRKIDPLTYAPKLRGRKVLMVNAKGDDIMPEVCVRRFHEAAGKPEIFWIDAGHYSAILYINEVLRRTVRFLLGT